MSSYPTTELPMPAEIYIDHRYPDALPFLQQHGPDTVAVLHDLLINARCRDGVLVVETSVRQVADRLRFLSKDSVHRRVRELLHAGVLRPAHDSTCAPFLRRAYVVDLSGTGIAVRVVDPHP
jgi:hypothetical protein